MSIDSWLTLLDNSSLAAAVRGDTGWDWLFPSIEALHVLSMGAVFGTILMVDLRLVGLASRTTGVSKLSAEVLPYTWAAYAAAVVTGSLMFISRPLTYIHTGVFQLKFLCMLIAAINMVVFHLGTYRRVFEWDQALPPPLGARVAGALSLMLWLSVILFGRWTGFVTG